MLFYFAECPYAECRILFTIILNVNTLSVVMLNVIMLSVVILNVIMLSVVAPFLLRFLYNKGLSPVADDGNGEGKIAQNQKRLY